MIPSVDLAASLSRSEAAAVAETINEWERDGFHRAQLVQRRRNGAPANWRLLEDVLRDVQPVVQVAAGNESEDEIDSTLASGAAFAILGPRALDEPDWLSSTLARFPDQLLLTTPARERRKRSRGAVRTLPLDLRDLSAELVNNRLAGLIVEFDPDATFGHAELALLEDIADDADFPVLVAGGSPTLGTLRDLEFRGVAATIIDATHLSAAFDGQTLARSFSD
ncbi:MAG TPA: HisA/HisF-related TIM barrel protein [Gemmatimonadaceae bacterium]|nr:HisA/HisF-related TIM barrel protein [Gemmatimonadaceae bacterium]